MTKWFGTGQFAGRRSERGWLFWAPDGHAIHEPSARGAFEGTGFVSTNAEGTTPVPGNGAPILTLS